LEDRYISEILAEAAEVVEKVVEAVKRFGYILRKLAKQSAVRLVPASRPLGETCPSSTA
jgi:hypothetical protein